MLLSVIWLLVISPRLFHPSMGTHVLPRRLLLSFIVKLTVTWPDIEFSRVHYHILLGSEGKVGMGMCKLPVRLKVEIHEIHPNLRNPVSLIGL